jgi:hypothetical protein
VERVGEEHASVFGPEAVPDRNTSLPPEVQERRARERDERGGG